MKYALVDGLKKTPKPQMHAECLCCGSKVISKCGDKKLWHWAHYSKRNCDIWWENETQWHRDWKEKFPVEWQEVIHKAEHGEKHIADVKTAEGWALEFQHSYLKPEERKSRNAFYPKIVWVVDGLRRTRDKEQFFKLLNEMKPVYKSPHISKVYLDESALLREWSGNHCPVFFDFGDDLLWCLLPLEQNMWGYVVAFSRQEFVNLHNGKEGEKNNFERLLNQFYEHVTLLEQKWLVAQKREYANFKFDGRYARTRRWRL
ncbi:MAG: competence protein CoiA [Candidatus Berkiella sp.]